VGNRAPLCCDGLPSVDLAPAQTRCMSRPIVFMRNDFCAPDAALSPQAALFPDRYEADDVGEYIVRDSTTNRGAL